MSIEEYFGEWTKVVDLKEADRIMKSVTKTGFSICPMPSNIFKAFRCCPYRELRVVIIGQDPYPNYHTVGGRTIPVATGIAFANSPDTPQNSYSPSLDTLRESVIDFTVPHRVINFDPSLEKWEKQGVLMLNAALTCIKDRPGSHMLMWRPFMKKLLMNLSVNVPGLIYVLMGERAKNLGEYISRVNNYIIQTQHPVYYARTGTPMPHNIWREVNAILDGQEGRKIKWYEEIN